MCGSTCDFVHFGSTYRPLLTNKSFTEVFFNMKSNDGGTCNFTFIVPGWAQAIANICTVENPYSTEIIKNSQFSII